MKKIPNDIQKIIDNLSNKRALVVINHIIKHGQITTEDLEIDYGYKHPPRAARDVRESGIPLRTVRVKSRDGSRTIGAYTFGDFTTVRNDRLSGRKSWPKDFKIKLSEKYGQRCHLSDAELPLRALQVDHRIPYEIDGDSATKALDLKEFMLLSGTMNTAKAWSCRNCKNTIEKKEKKICQSCYWAYPEKYSHVAMKDIRRLDLVWQGKEVKDYDQLIELSREEKVELPEFIKLALKKLI